MFAVYITLILTLWAVCNKSTFLVQKLRDNVVCKFLEQ
jgi:hypothetical protein